MIPKNHNWATAAPVTTEVLAALVAGTPILANATHLAGPIITTRMDRRGTIQTVASFRRFADDVISRLAAHVDEGNRES